jgi:PAS domain S-box-containing protein
MQVKKNLPVVLCAAALLLPAAACAQSQTDIGLTPQEKEWVARHPVISVAPDPDFPPIEWFDKKGKFTGIAADYVAIVQKRLGITFKIVRYGSWDEILTKVHNKEVDMLSAAALTPQRSEYLIFSAPHVVMPGVIITRKNVQDNMTLAQLRKMEVAVVSGYVWQEFVSRDHPDIMLDPVPDVQTGLRKVSFGMIDAMVENLATATTCIEKEGITNLKVAGETGYFTRLSFAVRKDWPELQAVLNKALASIDEGTKKAIFQRWIHMERQPLFPSRLFWVFFAVVLGVVACVIIAILVWNRALSRQVGERTSKLTETVRNLIAEVSEREHAEAALRESEQKFLEMVEHANSVIIRMDTKGNVTFFNKFAQDFFGFAKEEILGKNIIGTIVPQTETSGRDLAALMDDLYAHPERYARNENENMRKNGERVWIAWTNKPIIDKQGRFAELLCVGNDITDLKRVEKELEQHRIGLEELVRERTSELSETIGNLQREIAERRRAEDALIESERRYRFLFDDSPAGSVIIGSDGLLKDINKSFEQVLGYTRDEIIGRPAVDFIAAYDRERVAGVLRKRFGGDKVSEEIDTPVLAKDGSLHFINFAGGQAQLFDRDAFIGVLITGVDVTERRTAEKLARQQQQKLIQADKMATLGVLVSGVAHEINNPNNFIILNSDNLSDIWKDLKPVLQKYREQHGDFMLAGLHFDEIREEVQPLISGISEGAKRIRNIVQNLKDFARQEPGDMNQMVQINAVVEAATVILGNLIKKSTDRFSFINGQGIPPVKGAFQKIEQVIINLVSNACQALTARDQEVMVATSYAPERGRVVVTVRDSGAGISPENLKHIMDPFFTTKRDSGGTGLGLAISYTIIKDHGGDLTIESEPGKGTLATMSLPAA